MNKSKQILRWFLYALGIVVLALGLTLNTKTGLGTSPIISISAAIAEIYNINLGDVTFVEYSLIVVAEMILHFLMKSKKEIYILDILQIPFSIVFTRFMNIFSSNIPYVTEYSMFIRIIVLIIAIIFTGVGAALTLRVKIVPNPADGLVQTIAQFTKKETGLIKNIFDFSCIALTIIFCLLFRKPIVGVGIGTIIAMILTGRVMAIFNKLVTIKFDT